MTALQRCAHCEGFIPPQANQCPYCGATAKPTPNAFLRGLRNKLLSVAGGGAVAITLMACYGAAYDPPPVDAAPPDAEAKMVSCPISIDDQDGDCIAADLDCDDGDPAVRPGVVDRLGDEIDQNCDGADGAE